MLQLFAGPYLRGMGRLITRYAIAAGAFATVGVASAQSHLWTNTLGGLGNERGLSVAMDTGGGFFVCGTTDSPLADPNAAHNQDVTVYKYSSTGTSPSQSTRLVTTDATEVVKDSVVKNGYVYVLYTRTSTTYPTMGQLSLGVVVYDATTLAVDSARSSTYRYSGLNTEGAGITVDDSNNIYVTGNVAVTSTNHDVLTIKNPYSGSSWVDTEAGPGFPYSGTGKEDFATDIATDGTYVYVGATLHGSASPYATYQAVLKYPVSTGASSPTVYANWQTGFEGTTALSMAFYNGQAFLTGGSLPNSTNPQPWPSCVTLAVNTATMTKAWSTAYAYAGNSSYGSSGKGIVAGPAGVFVYGDAVVNGSPVGPQPTEFVIDSTGGAATLMLADGHAQETKSLAGHSSGRLLLAGGPSGTLSQARGLRVFAGATAEDLVNGTGGDLDYYVASAFDPVTGQSVAVGTVRTLTIVTNPDSSTTYVYHDDIVVTKFAAQ